MTVTLTWPRVVGMELRKSLDKYVSSKQRWMKSVIRLGNNEVLKILMKTLNCDVYLKVMVMSADGADNMFWPVAIMIPNRNQFHHVV